MLVSHLTCPLPPHQSDCITVLVSHLTCPLPPHQTASLHDHVTALVSHLTCPLPPHQSDCITTLPHDHVSQSFDLPPATTSVSHLTYPLPLCYHIVASLCHCISQSFESVSHLPHHQATSPHYHVTALVSHLTCPLPPHQSDCITT